MLLHRFALLFGLACGEAGGASAIELSMKTKCLATGCWRSLVQSICLSAVMFFYLAPVCASTQLPEVVVTSSRTEQRQTDTLLHSTVITADMIKNSQQVDLPSLLRAEAGIQITQTGGIGSATGFFMRGAATRQTLVLIDGVPITKQDATGTVSIEHLMLAEIDRIEIVRGNVSSIYGSGAVGGVIQIFTRKPTDKLQTVVSGEYGSRSSYSSAASIRGASDDVRYAISASALGTAGFSATNPSQLTNVNSDNDGYKNISASGSISKSWLPDQELGIRFTQSQGRFDFDSHGQFASATDIYKGKTNVSVASIFSKNRLAENWLSDLTLSESADYSSNLYQTTALRKDSYKTQTRMADWLNRIDLSDSVRATAGLTYQRQSLVGDDGDGGLSDFARQVWSAQGGIEYDGNHGHSFQLNGRHDNTQGNVSANTGLWGYGYRLNEKIKLIASTSTGFSAPPLGYLYGQYGNPTLRPEYSHSSDIGAQISLSALEVRVTRFESRIRDQIEYQFPGGFQNISAARNEGLEVSGAFQLAEWSIRPSLTLQNPRDADTGQLLRRRAKQLASLSAARSSGPWNVNAALSYAGERFDVDNRLAAYVVAGLSGSYQLSKEWSLTSRIDNMFDARYQSVYGYNQLPRTLFVGIRWQQ
ncbi:MAG: TonB-dependent receptor domain-containing protein [Burkholderiaceae bacterium]